jgi:type VI secretion system secreted protein Hcp
MWVLVAEQWFLKIDGIDGESTNAAHKDEIDVESWSWGVVRSDAPGPGAGVGSAKPAFQDMHFVARISKASPKLFLACATGSHHKVATLSGARTAGKSVDYLKYKLSDVQVTSVQHSDSEAGAPIEQFSLQYRKFEMSYSPQTATGTLGAAATAGFDVQQNKQL